MERFISKTHAVRFPKLEPRTHSSPADELTTESEARHASDTAAETIIKVTRFPSGDISVSHTDRVVRTQPKVVQKRAKGAKGDLTREDQERTIRRNRRKLWTHCQRMSANGLATLTRRGGFATREEAWEAANIVQPVLTKHGCRHHVRVLEKHTGERNDGHRSGANLGTFHVHIVTNRPAFIDYEQMHEDLRHVELKAFGGDPWDPAQRMLNVNWTQKRNRKRRWTPASIARYLSPYLNDDEADHELHRKRFDVSRGLPPLEQVEVRCSPLEVSSPAHVCQTLVEILAPGRTHSSPFELHLDSLNVHFHQQSGLDWGNTDEPPPAGRLPTAAELWELIPKAKPKHRDELHPAAANNSEQPGLDRANWLAAQLRHERSTGPRIAKPDRVQGRMEARAAGPSGPPVNPPLPSPTPLSVILQPMLDELERNRQN